MPPKIKDPEGFRSHIQMWNEGLTRTEFKTAFESVKTFVRAALTAFQSTVDHKLDTILEEQKKPGPAGPRGAVGPMGPQGPQGIQGPAGVGIAGKDADVQVITQKIELDLPQLGEAMRNGLELLIGEERLKISAIHGLEEALAKAGEHRDYGGGAVPISIHQSGTQKVQIAHALNFTGAGAPTVTHGANGVTNLAFPSGSGGLSVITVSGTVDDSNTSFTAASAPTMVNINGAFYIHGAGVTIVGTAITTDSPVGTGGKIFAV
jgi:hypothetical protein